MLRKLLSLFLLFFLTNMFSQSFESIWNTELNGSPNNEIIIPTNPAYTNYDYTVDWGDNNIETNITGDASHAYASPGLYTIKITGTFPSIYFNNTGDKSKIIEILSWGNIQWQTMENAFYGCENLNFDAIDSPDLSQVTTLKDMFRECDVFNGILNNWDVSTITDISGLFADCSIFNRPLDNWNTISVTNMSQTFLDAELFNEPLDNWRVDNVTDMSNMFAEASSFNQNINNWSVNNVTNMFRMFFQARFFNQPLDNWNVNNVTSMSNMFRRSRFNRPINNWLVDNVTDMSRMFSDCPFNQALDNWNVSNVTNMFGMFEQNDDFNQDINVWNVSSVTNMSEMFAGFSSSFTVFNQPLDLWDVSSVTNMFGMFKSSQFNQPLNTWNVSSVTTMGEMFRGATTAKTPFNQPLDNWNTSNVTAMNGMFSFSDFNQPIEIWDISNVNDMSQMFARNTVFNQPLNNWSISSLTNASSMFFGTTIFNQDLSNWDTSTITNMSNMFNGATTFNQNMGIWDVTNVTNMQNMLSNSGLSQENYDNTLIGWSTQTVSNNVNLGALSLQYCDSRLQRQSLIDNYNWVITGDAINCTNVFCTTITSPLDTDTNVPANSDIRWAPAPNADGYRVTLRRENGSVSQIIYDNQDFGNVVGLSFTNEFTAGDTIYVTVIPYNDEGPAVGCEEISFTVVPSWQNSPDAYKITIDTRLNGIATTPVNQFEMEVNRNFSYNYNIDWGDGQYTNNVSNRITHTYLTPGIYTIAVIGNFPAPYFSVVGDPEKIISIDQWGTHEYLSMENACYYCENMLYNATDIPDLSRVESMLQMFSTARLFDGNINNWDVSNIKDMSRLFSGASTYNQPLDNWVVDNVENMRSMFSGAGAFNQPIGNWNTSLVTNMSNMFGSARAFNQNINGWDVSNVTTMSSMFEAAEAFNQPLDNWSTTNVLSMEEMFRRAIAFNQDINSWDVSNVQSMLGMFDGFVTDMTFNQPLNNWNVGNVLNMAEMFQRCVNFNQPLDQWNVSSVTTMFSMFNRATNFNQNIDSWNVTNVLDMSEMFLSASSFDSPLNGWDVNSVVNMSSMFGNASTFNQPLDNWDVSAVANTSYMFQNAIAFNQNINNWDVSSVTLMPSMFEGAAVFNSPLNDWDVSSVTNMREMFKNAPIFNLPLNNWDTGEVLTMQEMFFGAILFNQNIDNWDVSFVNNMQGMFREASSYNETMESWNVASVTTMESMFRDATSFNTLINNWNVRGVGTMKDMFYGATSYNQTLNDWRVNGVENMEDMFRNASSYNQVMDAWNIGNVTMRGMFRDAIAFNQNLVTWDVSNVTDMTNMLDRSALSRENYDATLIAWSELTLTPGLSLGAETLLYCDALAQRQSIIDNFGWSINGDILDCPIPECTQLILPLNGATNVPVNTNLTWEDVLFASGYTLEITIQPGNIVINETLGDVTSYEFATDFTGGETVSVTIIPFNNEGNAVGPCILETFTISNDTATVPDCTTLTEPLNGDINVMVDTNLTWAPITNADGYKLSVVTNPGGIVILNNEDVGNLNTYNLLNDLPENTVIDVTIIPYNDQGDAINCSTESFTTQIIPTAPACTTMNIPLNGAINIDVDTNISWNAIANATGYLISIGTTSNGIEIENSRDVGNATTYDIPDDLQPSRTYYVTIIPYNDIGDASGCIEETFTTASLNPACTNLTSPVNGDTDVAITLNQITWDSATNASAYRITITGTANNDIANFETTDTFYNFTNPFVNREVVSVTIIPFDGSESAIGCTTESFTIIPTTPDCTNLTSPLDGATDIATTLNQITWSPATNATAYKVTISGTANNNITDFETTDTFYNFTNPFLNDEVVSVTVVPVNATVDAVGCATETFTIIPETPNCTNLVSPANGAIDVATTLNQITWNPVTNATAYKVTISGTANNNITDFETTDTFLNFTNPFLNSEVVSVIIVPVNGTVEATNCSTESFTIIPVAPDCTNLANPANGDINVATTLSQITWSPATNATAYKVTISGTANNNITDFETTDTFYNFTNPFLNDEVVSVTIVPVNATVDAVGCATETFTIIPETPNCTNLVSPANGAIDVATTLNQITWNPVTNTTAYKVTISGTANNNITDFETTDTFLNFTNPFLNSEVVSVIIVPINGTVEAAGCVAETFTIIPTTPDCTNLTSPLDGATDIATTLNQITWSPATNATRYKVTVTGTANNNITDFETTDTFYNFTNPFLNDEVVSVTIVPVNATVDAVGCVTETFTIIPETPNCTNLVSPANGAIDVATTLNQITWNPVTNATAYKVTISGTANNNITDFETTDTFLNFTNPFLVNEIINVSIIPINGTVEADNCTQESFNIVRTPECTNLTNPSNDEIDVAIDIEITWESIINATGYLLSVGTTSGGNDIVDNLDVGLTTTFNFDNDLDGETIYYVTIIPYNVNGEAQNCNENSFTTLTIPKNDVEFGFSPNGDGINDFWNIDGMDNHPNNVVSIFNRWGDLVFQINNYNNTSNVFRGIANKKTKLGADVLPDGTYFYQFTIDGEHNFETLKGYVVIKR